MFVLEVIQNQRTEQYNNIRQMIKLYKKRKHSATYTILFYVLVNNSAQDIQNQNKTFNYYFCFPIQPKIDKTT